MTGAERQYRYHHSPKGLVTQRRYNRSDAHRAASLRYFAKPEAKEHKNCMARSRRLRDKIRENAL